MDVANNEWTLSVCAWKTYAVASTAMNAKIPMPTKRELSLENVLCSIPRFPNSSPLL